MKILKLNEYFSDDNIIKMYENKIHNKFKTIIKRPNIEKIIDITDNVENEDIKNQF